LRSDDGLNEILLRYTIACMVAVGGLRSFFASDSIFPAFPLCAATDATLVSNDTSTWSLAYLYHFLVSQISISRSISKVPLLRRVIHTIKIPLRFVSVLIESRKPLIVCSSLGECCARLSFLLRRYGIFHVTGSKQILRRQTPVFFPFFSPLSLLHHPTSHFSPLSPLDCYVFFALPKSNYEVPSSVMVPLCPEASSPFFRARPGFLVRTK
jgi:hypothetical protein